MAKRSPKGEQLSGPAPMKAEVVREADTRELDGRHLAAQDAMAAISEKSPEKFMEAMSNFHNIHSLSTKE